MNLLLSAGVTRGKEVALGFINYWHALFKRSKHFIPEYTPVDVSTSGLKVLNRVLSVVPLIDLVTNLEISPFSPHLLSFLLFPVPFLSFRHHFFTVFLLTPSPFSTPPFLSTVISPSSSPVSRPLHLSLSSSLAVSWSFPWRLSWFLKKLF